MEPQRQKFIRCKMNMTMDKFKQKRDDSYQKTCDVCLEMRNVSAKKHQCVHHRKRCECKECGGGVSICEHNNLRNHCKECDGISICEHSIQRSHCKLCGGGHICEHNKKRSGCKLCSDPLKITIKNMLSASKKRDKKNDIYDFVNFVDHSFLENLLDDYSHCCYPDCNKELQIIHYRDDLATIERLDNSIGHIKSNCVICCFKCNNMRKSNRQ